MNFVIECIFINHTMSYGQGSSDVNQLDIYATLHSVRPWLVS